MLAWAAALAAVEPLVRGYLTSVPDQRMVDLDVYRTGGLSVLQGQPLYAVLTQPPQLLPFTYPPAAALFAVPLALLPWAAAQLAWVPFIYVPLAVVIWFAFAPLLRRVPSGGLRAAAFAVIFAACAYLFPLRDEMRFGQVDMVLLAMAVADCAARAPRWPRGVLVGLATAIKLVPGVFIVYLWLSGRRRAAVTAAVAALAATLGAWLLLPRDSVTYWTSVIFESGRLGSNAGTSNQSLRGILLRVFLPGQAPGALWAGGGRRGGGGRLRGGPAAGAGVQGDGGNRGHRRCSACCFRRSPGSTTSSSWWWSSARSWPTGARRGGSRSPRRPRRSSP